MLINQDRQQLFAQVSADYNPLHVDKVYAYNSMFQKQVVHGIHQVFCALEDFSSKIKGNYQINKITVKFENALGVDEDFQFEKKEITEENAVYRIINNKQELLSDIKFSFEKRNWNGNKFNKKFNYKKQPQNPPPPRDL